MESVNRILRRAPAWPLYLLAVLPIAWIFWQGAVGNLGVDPTKAVEHQVGEWALWLLIAGLSVTPLQRFAGLRMLKFRRAIGVVAFAYVTVHLLVWLVLDVQFIGIWKDIVKRPYVTVGMAAFVLLIPLVATSNNWAVRQLGALAWQRLHKLAYATALLGSLHFVLLVKGWQPEPLAYLLVVVGLLAVRLIPRRKPVRARTVSA